MAAAETAATSTPGCLVWQAREVANQVLVDVDGRQLKLSNLDKVLYPAVGLTKAQVIDYYTRVAPAMLPHLHGRPLTLKRYPDGVSSSYFYEKNCPSHRPPWVRTIAVRSRDSKKEIHYCVVDDLPSLVWAANLACIEFHTSLSLGKDVLRPTMIVFDLDPGAPADIVQCCEVGLRLRAWLDERRLDALAKTSGSKGLQVYVPLNTSVSYEETKTLALNVAHALEAELPKLVVSSMSKSLRPGKVFVDWSQNDDHKTTICVYSLRAREQATVSTPVTWDEVEECARRRQPQVLAHDAAQVLRRVEERGDLFAPVLRKKQKLPA